MKIFIFSLITVVIIFGIHILFFSHYLLLVPFLWSFLFIYLYGKNYLNIAINSFLLLILIFAADYLNFGPIDVRHEFAYSSLVLFITFLFVFVYQELATKRLKIATVFSYTITLALYAISISYIIYAISFNTISIEEILYSISQTNLKKSIEFITDSLSFLWIMTVLFTAIFMGYLLFRQEEKETPRIERSLLLFIIIMILGATGVQRRDIRLLSSVIFLKDSAKHYAEELNLFRKTQLKRKTGAIKFEARKDKKGETYIVIIGEALNKKHMGIYGYMRNTTPLLSEKTKSGELLLFTNIYSNHTHTMPAISFSLTEANQYNNKSYYNSLSIVDILNRSEIETHWITNQAIDKTLNNPVSIIAHETDNLVVLNHTAGKKRNIQKHDGVLIDEVKKVLAQKTNKNRVVFIHLIGNHWSYSSKYPKDEYTIYKEKLKLGEFGRKASKNSNINNYDNSVHYYDYVINSILEELQKEKGVGGFIYMPDHSNDTIRDLGHLSREFTYEMTQIPMIAWFSDDYKKVYSDKYNIFARHKNTLFSNDMFYDTMIGLLDIKTDKYNSKYDFTSKDYKLDPKDALVLYGKKYYTDKSNYIYWQTVNTQYLVDSNQSNRIIPHRVDSLGKLKDVWNDGFRSFELDARFGDNNTTFFQIGHDEDFMGLTIEDFLSSSDFQKIKKVWLDFKNLNQNNYKQALERLEYLDKKYNIKRKFIVESPTTSSFFKEIGKAGWHTSYYMPTKKILKLLKEDNKDEMQKLAIKIANQTKIQNLSAVSFDNGLYPFVKNYLESSLSNDIVYHTWWEAPALYHVDFKERLLKNKLYLDSRVKTILPNYKSEFDL
ncbi:hypothetical protein TSL6_10710 [Sulfurovum sp. TSL6]|uniref:phosphoethanolamine transferase n=1 Tax=Sulfurovum sp. TSL6 TaxID=2826995 RepID=UPI001CC6B6AF|nr:sulfatase-like hydrolase/transferase [Sulfurovum sp. TSL6]GIU00565.1 hypothetical protein TSL6_10710 [Sulfurovum sp. TSL6]